MDYNERAILKTLLYSSLFAFPLTEDELYRYLISDRQVSFPVFQKALEKSPSVVSFKNTYYALKEQKESISTRVRCERLVEKNYEAARHVSRLLSYIPTIYFIGLSGSLAAGSTKDRDDIDFFIITKKNTLFISRLSALILLQLIGKRRKRKEQHTQGKVCLNMWIDMTALTFSPSHHDIYTAREVAQMKPLFSRENVYQYFLQANSWVTTFLPHAFINPFQPFLTKKAYPLLEHFLALADPSIKVIQLFLIRRHTTKEKISSHILFFHPFDYRNRILSSFKAAWEKQAKLL